MTLEDKKYKHSDYLDRKNDPYAGAKYRIIMSWLPKRDNLRVLNAGCGSGEMNILLGKNRTWSIDAIDTDEEAVRLSQNATSSLGVGNIRVFRSNIERYVVTKPYDVIVCNDVFEHIEDDRAAMKKLSESLKEGGALIASVPALHVLFGYHDEMLGHYRRYSKKEIIEKLSAGFEVKKCRYFGFSLIPIAFWYSRIRRAGYPMEKVVKNSSAQKTLNAVFRGEEFLGSPIGTTLLVMAVKKK